MTFYTSISTLTELLMLAMVFHVLHYSGFTREQRMWYLLTFIAIMLCTGAEFAVHCGRYDPRFSTALTVLTVLQFSTAPMLGVLFAGSLGMHHRRKIALVFFALNLAVETVAAFFGWVFRFTDEGYFRGDLFFIYEVFYFASLLYLIISMVRVGRRFRHRDTTTICMILVIVFAGIVPMTLYRLNVTYMAIAMSATLCYIYYNDLVQQDSHDELVANQEKMTEMQGRIITGLASLIENRDMETGEHVSRTSFYVKTLAEAARQDGVYTDVLSDHFIFLLYTLAPMHDIGKITIPDHILQKPGKLTPEEFEIMKGHAAAGGAMVRDVLSGITDEEYLSFAADIAKYHHERWDGTGYPEGLAGEAIPLSARIMALADVFDALISQRCYKAPMSPEEAFTVIREEAGSHFDPRLAKVFLDHWESFLPTAPDGGTK